MIKKHTFNFRIIAKDAVFALKNALKMRYRGRVKMSDFTKRQCPKLILKNAPPAEFAKNYARILLSASIRSK
jgi:hypothetical protein